MIVPIFQRQFLRQWHAKVRYSTGISNVFNPLAKFPSHTLLQMPALSPTMTQGNLGKWHKQIGDEIQPGDILVEVETDKAQMDYECQEEGFLAQILMAAGSKDVLVNKAIGVLVDNKDDIPFFKNFTLESIQSPDSPVPQSTTTASTPQQQEASSLTPQTPSSRAFASPLAKMLAAQKGIDLALITPTGPNSRIVKADVDSFKQISTATATKSAPTTSSATSSFVPAPSPAAPTGIPFKDIPLSNVRKVIAQRLSLSKSTIPHYYLQAELNVDKILKLRQILNDGANGKFKLSVNDFIVKAASLALKAVPEVNSSWQDTFIRQYTNADIAVAVATENGLITPIVTAVEGRGLSSISNTIKEMASRAKENKLSPNEYQGGTFTISNLGMFNIQNFSAIINPPHSGILSVGSIGEKLVFDQTDEKGFKRTQVMQFTLSLDHRSVDGAVGARWLLEFRKYLEEPLNLLV